MSGEVAFVMLPLKPAAVARLESMLRRHGLEGTDDEVAELCCAIFSLGLQDLFSIPPDLVRLVMESVRQRLAEGCTCAKVEKSN